MIFAALKIGKPRKVAGRALFGSYNDDIITKPYPIAKVPDQ